MNIKKMPLVYRFHLNVNRVQPSGTNSFLVRKMFEKFSLKKIIPAKCPFDVAYVVGVVVLFETPHYFMKTIYCLNDIKERFSQ